jgi:hypothetical protein
VRTENTLFLVHLIGLHHPLDGITNPEYTLLRFIQLTKFFCKEKKALAFNRDRCCHLALCLWLILFHCLLFQFDNRKSMFAVMHSDIKSFKSGLLLLTGQPYCKKSRSAKVKDGIINLIPRHYCVNQYINGQTFFCIRY